MGDVGKAFTLEMDPRQSFLISEFLIVKKFVSTVHFSITPHNIKLVETNTIISFGFILTLSGIQCMLGMPARTDIAVHYNIISFKKAFNTHMHT